MQIIDTGEHQIYTETAAKLTSLLNPMGSGLASGKSAQINFKKETRTYYDCESWEDFGKNTIAFSEKTFGDKFANKGGEVNTNKYIFAESIIEGKQLNLFSKPFNMPFKIDDVIVIFEKDYCFYQAPNEIKDELEGLNINIQFSEELENCTGTSVCFDSSKCDIDVYGMCEGYNCDSRFDYGKVFKGGEVLYYDDGLLYGAIFASPEIYECNLKRLMKRFEELSLVYIDKIKIIESKGCSSAIEPDLKGMVELTRVLDNSEDLFMISRNAEKIDAKNRGAVCKLY